jgi:hypothetical protein
MQSPEITSLIELLIDADPDSLLEKHANLLTPEQLWKACNDTMCDALKYGKGRRDVLSFLAKTDPEDFISENQDWSDAELLEEMVNAHPDICLEWIPTKLTPAQKKMCIERDLGNAVTNLPPDSFSTADIEKLVEHHSEKALLFVHSRLNDPTFEVLCFKHPKTAWNSDAHRLSTRFLEKHFIPNDRKWLFESWVLSDKQIIDLAKANPTFAWGEFRNVIFKERHELLNEWPPNPKEVEQKKYEGKPTATKKKTFFKIGLVFGIGIFIGLLIGYALHLTNS